MKVRNGFVSNSSSSSFVIVTTKDEHEKAFKKLNQEEKNIIKDSFSFDEKLGMVMFAYHQSDGSIYAYEANGGRSEGFKRNLTEDDSEDYEIFEKTEGAIDSYVDKVKNKMTVHFDG